MKLFDLPPTHFEIGEDVIVAGTEFGYVFGHETDGDMYLVCTHDGKDRQWCHGNELKHLTLGDDDAA
jgi:hypothetical protein